MKRIKLTPSGRKDGYLTTFKIPARLKQELAEICPGKSRTRWVVGAIQSLAGFDECERNSLLQADMRLRASQMVNLPIRLPSKTQAELRGMLTSFRKAYPELDLEISGIVRAAIIFHLRHNENRLLTDLK